MILKQGTGRNPKRKCIEGSGRPEARGTSSAGSGNLLRRASEPPTADSKQLEYRPGTICGGVPSSLGFGVEGESYSQFLASTVIGFESPPNYRDTFRVYIMTDVILRLARGICYYSFF